MRVSGNAVQTIRKGDKMRLTQANYYGKNANKQYMSVSQYKDFLQCEAMAMAKINGKYIPEKTRPLILGGLVDALLTEDEKHQTKYLTKWHDELFKKNGEPYADVKQAMETVIDIRNNQPLMCEYLGGKHQQIMTGEIAGIPWKIRIDVLHDDKIVDLKYIASFKAPNMFQFFWDYWQYDLHMAVYQEIVRQNIGKRLPTYLVVATKETPARKGILHMDDFTLAEKLKQVERLAPRFNAIKNGEIAPERCGKKSCDYCSMTEIITAPMEADEVKI